ncbi:MAG: BlaI/MecI/CopY family transcriptional regulator [Eubacteriales bacterium]
MTKPTMGKIERQFADIIWENEPLSSPELVILAEKELNWKKSTTYTSLKRLSERGIFQNIKGIVSSQMSREEFYALKSEEFIEDSFAGSLPRFLTAFSSRNKLTEEEIKEIEALIAESRGDS